MVLAPYWQQCRFHRSALIVRLTFGVGLVAHATSLPVVVAAAVADDVVFGSRVVDANFEAEELVVRGDPGFVGWRKSLYRPLEAGRPRDCSLYPADEPENAIFREGPWVSDTGWTCGGMVVQLVEENQEEQSVE